MGLNFSIGLKYESGEVVLGLKDASTSTGFVSVGLVDNSNIHTHNLVSEFSRLVRCAFDLSIERSPTLL